MTSREELVFLAKLAEQTERHQEMADNMRKLATTHTDLSREERNLLAVAYKNISGTRRSALRVLASIEPQHTGQDKPLALIRAYRTSVEKELNDICRELVQLLDDKLVPAAGSKDDPEAAVFYYKMKGDYLRYMAEFASGDSRTQVADQALKAYKTATDQCSKSLPTTHPLTLGLALNFSVFYYEILNMPENACQIAKQAFDEAIAAPETEPDSKDSAVIMQLLRDNLLLWAQDAQASGAGADAADASGAATGAAPAAPAGTSAAGGAAGGDGAAPPS